jgi:hypothetical protein
MTHRAELCRGVDFNGGLTMKNLLNLVRGAFFAGALACAALPAQASTYTADFTGSFFDVFATITTDACDNVIAITGNVTGPNGGIINALEPLGNPNWIYDNKFTSTDPHVSNGGILFLANGFDYNLYSVGSGPFGFFLSTFNPDGTLYNPGDAGTLDVTQTPLPAAGLLFGSTILGAFILRRRKKVVA